MVWGESWTIVLLAAHLLLFVLLALLYEWVDRKLVARLQNRYGPLYTGPSGILQPVADIIKLLSKEDIVPRAADRLLFTLLPILYTALPLSALFIIPVTAQTALVSFEGDLIFIMFVFTLIIIAVFLAGWSSVSRFSSVGAVRAALQMLGYDIPFTLAMIGPAVAAGTLSVSGVVEWQASRATWFLWLQPIGFIVLLTCSLAELDLIPFDIPEAETEIVAGWFTEFSGRKLALIRLGKDLELILVASLITALYLGGPSGWWMAPPIVWFLIKTTGVVLVISILHALFARFRIDQVVSGMWRLVVPLAILQVILIKLGLGG